MDINLEGLTLDELKALIAAIEEQIAKLEDQKGNGGEQPAEASREGEEDEGTEEKPALPEAVQEILDKIGEDVDELLSVASKACECSKALTARAEKREELRRMVAGGAGTVIKSEEGVKKMDKNEERAKKFAETRRTSVGCAELRSVLVSSDTIATPTGVEGINDIVGSGVSSILDMVKVVNCNGMGSNKVAYIAADAGSAADQTEGSDSTTKEPTFGYVTISPTSIACKAQISKQMKKQSPLEYEAKVTAQALLSLRKAVIGKINAKLKASSLVDSVAATISNSKGVVDEKTLRKLVFAYGGDESIVGEAVLFLNKTDLIAFGDVRGTNEKGAVYEIIPDGFNPNTGIIKDGGLAVRYCINSGLTACAGTSKGASDTPTMFYGDPKCFELDLFSDYEVRVSEDYAFTSLMDTIVGDTEIGGDVVVKNGFVAMTIPHT